MSTRKQVVLQSGIPWLDSLIRETGLSTDLQHVVQGIPLGIWIQLVAQPGVGKSTLGSQILCFLTKDPLVEGWHCDFEMREEGARRMYRSIGCEFPEGYCQPAKPLELLDNIYARATELQQEGKYLVVLVDAFAAMIPTLAVKQQIEIATRIKNGWTEHPNLLLITIHHTTKTKGIMAGASQVQQLSDVVMWLQKEYGFVYLSCPKNRVQAAKAPENIKLARVENEGFVVSAEPDFLSSIPLIAFLRNKLSS